MISSIIKKIIGFSAVAGVLAGGGALVYTVDRDLFWGVLWFVFIASFVDTTAKRIARRRSKILFYAAAALAGVAWMFVNSSVYRLVAENINSNPYGEYFVSQFEFRLRLSLFILKIISQVWLANSRMAFVYLLFLVYAVTFPTWRKQFFLRLPQKYFEFFVHTFIEIKNAVSSTFATSFGQLAVNTFLWCLATFFLRFDNFVILTAIMALCSFTPRFGLFFGAAMAVIYVESGLFMLQLGGLFIATASIWFVDHTLFKSRNPSPGRGSVIVLLASLPVGYLLFSFPGLFAAAPFTHLVMLIGDKVLSNTSLIHTRKY